MTQEVRVFTVCVHGHLYSGATCPWDGCRSQFADVLACAVDSLKQAGKQISIESLRHAGVPEPQLRGTVIIEFGGSNTMFDAVAPGALWLDGARRDHLF